MRRRCPWLLTGWLWYLATLLPMIGIVQAGGQSHADRYTYLTVNGALLAAAWSAALLARGSNRVRSALVIFPGVPLLLFATLTWRQAGFWRDPATLFGHAARVTPESWLALYNLGNALELSGDAVGATRLYREVIRIQPGYAKAHAALGRRLLQEGRTDEGLAELRAAVAAAPENTVNRMTLALALDDAGRETEAVVELRELIRRSPDVPEAYNNLASLLARRGEVTEAMALLRRALTLDPSYGEALTNLDTLTRGKNGLPAGDSARPPASAAPSTHRRLFGASQGRTMD